VEVTAMLGELVSYLAAQGVGTPGVDLFQGAMPHEPDAALVLQRYPGIMNTPERGDPPSVAVERPRVQVLARAPHPAQAEARAQAAYRALIRLANQRLGATWYLRAEPLQAPFDLGRDDAGRWLVGFNVQIEKGLAP
jgi:hypothetical protein